MALHEFKFACPRCGQRLKCDGPPTDTCPACGERIEVPLVCDTPVGPGLASADPTEMELRAFIGPNADYYLERCSWAKVGSPRHADFNGPALLLGFIWALYRKLYLVAAALFAIGCSLIALKQLGILSISGVAIALAFGSQANSLYLARARKVITKARIQARGGQDYMANIARRGGTSLRAAIGLPIAATVALFGANIVLVDSGWMAGTQGKRLTFRHGELYYKVPVTKAQAQKVGEYLVGDGFFNGKPRTVQLCQPGEALQFRAVVRPGSELDPRVVAGFRMLAQRISDNVLSNAPLELELCDAQLQMLLATSSYGKRLIFKGSDLYYTPTITEEEAGRLGQQLMSARFWDGKQTAVLVDRPTGTFEVSMLVREGAESRTLTLQAFKALASDISQKSFGGAPVEIHLCREAFLTLAKVSAQAPIEFRPEKPN